MRGLGTRHATLILCFGVLMPAPHAAYARVRRDLLTLHARANDPPRWSLAAWLGATENAALTTSWLPLDRNARLIYGNVAATADRTRRTAAADLYLSMFTLRAEFERDVGGVEQRSLAAGLRVLGVHPRTTGLVARFGWAVESAVHPPRRFVEARAQLYLWSWLGLEGAGRAFEADGRRYEIGAFVELGPTRLFATRRFEGRDGVATDDVIGGAKIFF